MKMKKNTKSRKVLKLAEKAGFVLWSKNDWNPDRAGTIDWACEYDDELINFYDIVRQDLMKELDQNGRV